MLSYDKSELKIYFASAIIARDFYCAYKDDFAMLLMDNCVKFAEQSHFDFIMSLIYSK